MFCVCVLCVTHTVCFVCLCFVFVFCLCFVLCFVCVFFIFFQKVTVGGVAPGRLSRRSGAGRGRSGAPAAEGAEHGSGRRGRRGRGRGRLLS